MSSHVYTRAPRDARGWRAGCILLYQSKTILTIIKDKRTLTSYTLYIRSMKRFKILYDYLYEDAIIYLDRKYEKCKFINSKIEKSSTTKRETPY